MLEAGLIERLQTLVDEDVAAMSSYPGGPIAHYLHSSVMSNDPIDRVILATSRLAQGGNATPPRHCGRCGEVGRRAASAPEGAALDLVMLVGDGLYFNNALSGGSIPDRSPRRRAEALVALVERAVR
jgi:hypothetical protein